MKKLTVFVIDDDASICTALGRLMKSVGLDVRTFTSAKGFLDQGCQNMTGCLVLDVRMPEMGGLELQERLAQAGSEMPIVFMSAHEDMQTRERGLRAGAAAFLKKPIEDEVLIDAVKSVLSRFTEKG